jgi:predicted anti-sigma-YlaC factor YlaD
MNNTDPGMAKLLALPAAEREAFCRRVVENLSDLMEGEAPEDLCRRVQEVLADCPPYLALHNTLATTVELLAQCHEPGPEVPALEEAAFRRCVEAARQRLRQEDGPAEKNL